MTTGKHADQFMRQMIRRMNTPAAAELFASPGTGVHDCAVVGAHREGDSPATAGLLIGPDDDEAAVSRFAVASFSRFPLDCYRHFSLMGYDNDPRELFDIPEACRKAKRLLFDPQGRVRPFVRLLLWNDVDTPTYTAPAELRALITRAMPSAKGGALSGILFLAALAEGIRWRVVEGPAGLGWAMPIPAGFERDLQTKVFGVAGKTSLNAGELAREFRKGRVKHPPTPRSGGAGEGDR